jgi:hypothetical protein
LTGGAIWVTAGLGAAAGASGPGECLQPVEVSRAARRIRVGVRSATRFL